MSFADSLGSRGLRAVPVALAVSIAVVMALLVAQPAEAKRRSDYKPHNIRVTAVTGSSFTVSAAARDARSWRLFAATTRKGASIKHLRHLAKASARVRRGSVTLSGLRATSGAYYYRLAAYGRGGAVRYSTMRVVYLRPATPTALAVTTPVAGGLSLTWNESGPAGSFRVVQATDASMTQDRRTYVVTGGAHQLTPYGMRPGTRYYFQVAAANGPRMSGWSGQVSAVAPRPGQPVRMVSYNLLTTGSDGNRAGDGRVAPWSQRRLAAARLVWGARPDVIAVEEGNARYGSKRQVDSFLSALNGYGGDYALATTEPLGYDSQGRHDWTGPYLLYRTSKLHAVGGGGRWGLPDGRYAAYQLLESRDSGARFVAVATHLTSKTGPGKDALRQAEATVLHDRATAYAGRYDVPVVYGGDFNSHVGRNYKFDGPGRVFDAADTPDALDVATTVSNQRFNSANQYYRRPLATDDHIDHIYVSPGVAVTRWTMLLHLSGGRFVTPLPSDHNPVVADILIPTGQ